MKALTRVASLGSSALAALLASACASSGGGLAPSALDGRWETAQRIYNETNRIYGHYAFEFNNRQWTHTFTASADAEGRQGLFRYRVLASPFRIGASIPGAANAWEGDFDVKGRYLTALAPPFQDMFSKSQCGVGSWSLGQEQDVTDKGCAFIPSSTKCPTERDVIYFDGNTLGFGDRSGDMCSLPRPAKASNVKLARSR